MSKLTASFSRYEQQKRETVNEGDTGRETEVFLKVKGRELPEEIASAKIRVSVTPVVEITLTEIESGGWYFRWTSALFTSLPTRTTAYSCQVLATFDDDSTSTFPTGYNLEIKVNDPI